MSEWTTQAADLVEAAVGTVRDRAVVPVQRATNALVFGVLAACFVLPAVVLVGILLFRLFVDISGQRAWIVWLVLGGILVAAGRFGLWPRRAR